MTMAMPRSRQVFSQCRVAAGAEKSIITSGVGPEIEGDRHADRPDAGDFARVARKQRTFGAFDGRDDFKFTVGLGQGNQALAHAAGGSGNGEFDHGKSSCRMPGRDCKVAIAILALIVPSPRHW